MRLASFPSTTPPFAIWLQVTNGHGSLEMRIHVARVRPDHYEPDLVATFGFTLEFSDPRVVNEYVCTLTDGLVLDQAGDYRMTLTANGIEIAERYLVALPKP